MTSKKKTDSAARSTQLPNAQRPPHLTAEQMEAMLRPSPFRKQASKHLDTCADCREEVDTLAELLNRFRTTSVLYAEKTQASSGVNKRTEPRGRFALPSWRWSIAAGALACAMAAVPLVHVAAPTKALHTSTLRNPAQAQTVEMSDQALLEGVQNDLAASVPEPLELLAPASSSASSSAQLATNKRVLHKSSISQASH